MTDLEEIAFDALREIYQEAEPPLDFDHALENPDEYGENWYSDHTIQRDTEREILNKHLDKHDLTDRERSSVIMFVTLNYGPSYPEPESPSVTVTGENSK